MWRQTLYIRQAVFLGDIAKEVHDLSESYGEPSSRVTSELSPPLLPLLQLHSEAADPTPPCRASSGPQCPSLPGPGPGPGPGMPSVQVTDHDSDFTEVTNTTLTSGR